MGNRRSDLLAMVGESDHQETLRELLATHGRSAVASLVPEPENPHDPGAVAVVIDGRTVGYLSPAVAAKCGPVIRAQVTLSQCPATIHGGEWDLPQIGVLLDLMPIYAAARTKSKGAA